MCYLVLLWGGEGSSGSRGGITTVIILTYNDLYQVCKCFVCMYTVYCLYVRYFSSVLGHKAALSGSIQYFHTIPLQSVTQN
jgi:hypothetical protein